MSEYWLITEPARGTSVRVTIPKGSNADETLVAYAKQWDPDAVEEWEATGQEDEFWSFYSEWTGDAIQLIEETNWQ